MSTETRVRAGMNLIETNLIQALPEKPFITLRSQHEPREGPPEGGEEREKGREGEREGEWEGSNEMNECINFAVKI